MPPFKKKKKKFSDLSQVESSAVSQPRIHIHFRPPQKKKKLKYNSALPTRPPRLKITADPTTPPHSGCKPAGQTRTDERTDGSELFRYSR